MKSKQPKDFTQRLLSISGIEEAIGLVKLEARKRATKEAIEAGEKGKFGDELRHFLNDNSSEGHDKFLSDDLIKSFIGDSTGEWLDSLAIQAGPKIAELWGLSELAGDRLTDIIYWGDDDLYSPPFKFVIKSPNLIIPSASPKRPLDPSLRNALIGDSRAMQNGHIFLDVTYLSYDSLRSAYSAVLFMRERFGIESKDLREGAPDSIDTQKALSCVDLADLGYTHKEIARELGFPVSYVDNPSGSYPLLRKYLRRGREISQKLEALDSFLDKLDELDR